MFSYQRQRKCKVAGVILKFGLERNKKFNKKIDWFK